MASRISIARVDGLQPDSVAASAGFKVGDVVTSIDGHVIENFNDMKRIVATHPGSSLVFRIKRDSETITLTATPALTETKDLFGNRHREGVLGIQYNAKPGEANTVPVGFFEALKIGGEQVWFIISGTFTFIATLFVGTGSSGDLGGPLRIAQLSGQAASLGLQFVIQLCAMLSVSIGLLNLFPVPLLDGGHLLFYCGGSLARAAFIGAGAGGWVSDRIGSGADADDVRDLQRHPAFRDLMKRGFFMTLPIGNVLE